MGLEIVSFTPAMLDPAGALLALRHARLRATQPELSAQFEGPEAARAAVEAAWQRDGADGVAAMRAGRLAGYLIGDTVVDPMWDRSGWVRFAGCALAPDEDPELVRDMYAALAARWVRWGCFTHFAFMPVADEALTDRWFALCFGIEHVHALVDLGTLDLSPQPDPPGVEIRRAGPDDRAALEEVSDILWRHHVQAPVWAIYLPERQADLCRSFGDLATEPDVAVWLAFRRGEPVGIQGYYPFPSSPEDPIVPERCVHLCAAGTRESVRGLGIGRALTRHVLSHAHAAGYQFCETDWRSTNLLSSRFWPRRGFRPVVYRLVRRVDARIAWGREQSM